MNRYTPENMVKVSRYAAYFPTLDKGLQANVLKRIAQLTDENREYCDKGNVKHMGAIVTALALYEELQKSGMTEPEAFKTVSEEMWKALDPAPMQKLARKKWFLSVMKVIVPFGFKHGSGKGWRYTWHKGEDPKDRFHFECNECLYQRLFAKYGVEKLGLVYCHADVINYGSLPFTDFRRTGTLCRGDACCNFDFVRHETEDGWERTKSV